MDLFNLNQGKIGRLFDALRTSAKISGLEFTSFSEVPHNGRGALSFLASNYASPWVYRYLDNAYHRIDPLVQMMPLSDITIDWGEVSDIQREFFAEAAGFGLKSGIAIPLHVPGHTYVVCFADKQDAPITPVLRSQLEGLSFVFLQTWMREIMPQFDIRHLSPKVLKTVSYALTGCSVSEISDRLGIRRSTVERHLRLATETQGAAKRPV